MNWQVFSYILLGLSAVLLAGLAVCLWWLLRSKKGNVIQDIRHRASAEPPKGEAEEPLWRQLKELTILHAVATAGAEATDENMLIERATQIIGENLYPDNFGLLLLDESAGCLRTHPSYRERDVSKVHLPIPLGKGICGQVAVSGKPMRVPDVHREPFYLKVDTVIRSEVCVPLKIGERVIGVINAESAKLGAFTESDERLLSTLAGQLATAIDRLRAESAVRHRASQLAILSRVSREVVASLIPDQVYAAIHQAAAQMMTTETFLIALLDEERQEINPVYFVDRHARIAADRIPASNGLVGQVISTGEALLINECDDLGDFPIPPSTDNETARSLLAVPMRLGGKVFGMLSCQSYRPGTYTQEDLQTLSTLANQAAIAIENARLFDETQRRLEEIIFLSQIIAITATENDLSAALNRICAELAHFFQVSEVFFALFNAQFSTAQIIAEYHTPDRPNSLGIQIPVVENPAMTYILENEKHLAIVDADIELLLAPIHKGVEQGGFASLLLVPIVFGGEVIGILEIADQKRREFAPVEIALVEKVVSQVGQVLERLGLFAATREQAERMAQLALVSEGLNRQLTLEQVIRGIGEGAMALTHSERAALYLRGADNTVSASWTKGLSPEYLSQVTGRVAELPGGILMHSQEPILLSDLEALPESSLLRRLGLAEGFRSVELWPLVYEDQVVAAIGCYYDQTHTSSDAEHEVMLAFARQAAVALQNARLFDETRRRAAHLEALNAIISAVAAASDLQSLLEIALDHTLRALGLQVGGIWVGDEIALRGFSTEFAERYSQIRLAFPYDMPTTIAVQDWEAVDDIENYFRFAPLMAQHNVRASLYVPLLAKGRRIGGLAVSAERPRLWLAEEIALLEGVGRQLGGAAERIALLEKIQENARQVQQIMDTVPEGVFLLDEERRVLLANPVAQEYLRELTGLQVGDTLDRLSGKPLDDLLTPDVQVVWSELETEGPPRRIFELAVQPLKAGDQPGGWVVVLRDVTQERENQARIQMQERLATVGQLAAGIAHDFNNIMAAIVVYADLLRRDPNLPAASRDRLLIIQQQVQRAASLIRQILDFSRRSVMEQSTLDLLPFIKELDKLLRRVLPETIRLELTYQPGIYLVNADPTRLQQVFMNLAVNARDASPRGGILHFELERLEVSAGDPPPCPEIPPGTWIRITVKDSGEGIPPEVLPHIFEPFFTTKSVGQGTGLGLAQAYGIIKQHDGYIDAHSQVGKGATFHIYLRSKELALEEAPSPETVGEAWGAGEMLLVVEDDVSTREAMRALLEAYNYQVFTAADGLEALRIYEQHAESIALVVSDIVMPVMGGVALFRALQERWPQVKMLFVTGHPMDEHDQSILEQGNVHWLQKPFSVGVFSQIVQDLLHEA